MKRIILSLLALFLVISCEKENNVCNCIQGDNEQEENNSDESVVPSFGSVDEYNVILQALNYEPRKSNLIVGSVFPFLYFSDIHYDITNSARIIDFYHKAKQYLKCGIICGGDLVEYYWGEQSNGIAQWDSLDTRQVMLCLGNHDAWDKTWGDMMDKVSVYSKLFAQKIDDWDVVQPDNAESLGLMYYYKDYPDEKSTHSIKGLRLVVLDCMYWTTEERQWLDNVLESATNKQYAVIACSHYPIGELSGFDSTFNTIDNNSSVGSCILNNSALSAVQKFINDGGEFICWLCGHNHKDYLGTLLSYPMQVVVGVGTASCKADQTNYSDMPRIRDTQSQDLFDVISFDTFNKTINIGRIGANYDRYMRHKTTACVQYKSSTVSSINAPTLRY